MAYQLTEPTARGRRQGHPGRDRELRAQGRLRGRDRRRDPGRKSWRFNTIARPGEPQRRQLERRAAREAERRLDLARAQLRPRARARLLRHRADLRHRAAAPSGRQPTRQGQLRTRSTPTAPSRSAPNTGKLAWYYQHVANDQWDLDWVFERTDRHRADRRQATQGGDERRQDGDPRGARRRDRRVPVLGRRRHPERDHRDRPEDRRQDHRPRQAARSRSGRPTSARARSARGAGRPTSYSPQTQLVYLPLTESCMRLGPEGFRLLTSGVGISGATHPGDRRRQARPPAGDRRREPEAGVEHRPRQLRPPPVCSRPRAGWSSWATSTLRSRRSTTATGELLWRAKLDDTPSSSVVTYQVDGKQYVAVVVGFSNFHIQALQGDLMSREGEGAEGATTAAAASPARAESPAPPKGGAAIWVFAL